MNRKMVAPLVLAAFAAPGYAYDYTETAEVVSAVPIYQTVNEPRQHCWNETVTHYEPGYRSGGGAIIGGITGGLLGAHIGKGDGRIAAAATAAAIGAVIGDRLDNRDSYAVPVSREVQRCQVTDNYRQVVSGYQVTYYYGGRNTTVIMPYDPGARVRIGVGITDNGATQSYVLPQSGHAHPAVTRVTYVVDNRDVQVWKHKPYKRPRHGRNRDD